MVLNWGGGFKSGVSTNVWSDLVDVYIPEFFVLPGISR